MENEGVWIMVDEVDDEDIINVFLERGLPRKYAEQMVLLSKNETKKKKKYRINIYGELEEIEEQYDYYVSEILKYPPNSNPPTANNKQSLCNHFMVFDPTI